MAICCERIRTACMVLAGLLWPAGLLLSQTNIESNAGVQLDFLNPGARSLAIGGAFVGFADDATAAFTNPAGLRLISRKEFSAEGRNWSFATPFTSGGRLDGTATQQGIDVTSALTTGQSLESAAGVSFLSFVYPGTRWAVAAYRQQMARFRYSAQSSGPFVTLASDDARLNPYQATLDADIARYGVSGSYALHGNTSIGVGVYVYDFTLSSEAKRFAFDPNRPQFYATPDFSTAPVQVETQSGSDHRVGLNVGLTVAPHPKVQVGAVFRQGADFGVQTVDVAGSRKTIVNGTFTVPDVVGIGTLVKPLDQIRVVFDYNRVLYSQIAASYSVLFAPIPGYTAQASDFKIDDANEFHVGLEYLLLNLSIPIALRAGSWFDPDHTVRFEPSSRQRADPYNLAVFRSGKDVFHTTFGAGLVFSSVEINAAADLSEKTDTVSVSTVVRF